MAAEDFDSSPLTPQTKQDFLSKLRNIDDEKLREVLVEAAMDQQQFPSAITEKISSIQKTCLIHHDDKNILEDQENSLRRYFTKQGVSLFRNISEQAFLDSNWKSGLLFFLNRKLNLGLAPDPVVEGTIKNGKIYWRTVNPKTGQPIADGPKSKRSATFEYKKADCWRMTVEKFREFKAKGKRTGSGEITDEKFMAYFIHYDQAHAQAVLRELKEIEILTLHNRLNAHWRSLSNKIVTLASLQTPVFKGFPLLTYSLVIQALNVLACDQRPERSPKNWASTGRVTNNKLSQENATQLWDVGTWDELNTYSQTGDTLDHDHIPSACVLDDYKNTMRVTLHASLETAKAEREKCQKTINALKRELATQQGKPLTRQQKVALTSPELVNLRKKRDELKKIIVQQTNAIYTLDCDTKVNWWTIAIPHSLHKKGLTHKETKNEQKKIEFPFHDEVDHYLKLSERKNYHLDQLGAFRNLFRAQTKKNEAVKNNISVGITPFHFFQQRPGLTDKIDTLFNTRLQKHLDKTEGLKKPTPIKFNLSSL